MTGAGTGTTSPRPSCWPARRPRSTTPTPAPTSRRRSYLNSRDAWLPVARSYGPSAKLDVFMTSDAGRRWVLAGRFPGADLGGIFFLSPSTGFIETDVNGGLGEGQARIYATSDGGKHWREVSVINVDASFASITAVCTTGCLLPAPASASSPGLCVDGTIGLERTSDGGRTWGYIPIAPYDGDHAGPPTPRCSRPPRSAAWSWRCSPCSASPPPPTPAATGT